MEASTEIILSCCPFNGGVSQFRQILRRWNECPHYVNRRLSGVSILFLGKILSPQTAQNAMKLSMQTNISSSMDIVEILSSLKSCGLILEQCNAISSEHNLFISVKKLLPRNIKVFASMFEITIFDHLCNETIFIGIPNTTQDTSFSVSPVLPYSIRFSNDQIFLAVFDEHASDKKSVAWLQDNLLPKLQRWSEETQEKVSENIKSLSLVSVEKYTQLYQELKIKYGQKIVDVWPENTDPLKFVYEDVAIATYLLLLWEIQRDQCKRPSWKQSFADLGCGNGLLVYILSNEGHDGVGIDVRKRKIWDLYPKNVKLKVETFDPSKTLFLETDWIIGNHSDELTPWIPVIAARSSYSCNFFLLPCCAYEFSGHKYKRIDSSRSQYSEYLEYVKNVCQKCGFKINTDRLKIPSTKRICVVTFERSYPEGYFKEKEKEILEYIETRHRETGNISGQAECTDNTSEKQPSHVKLRDSVEKVRNCTRLPKEVVNNIIQHVVQVLLAEQHRTPVENDKGEQILWNAGGCINLSDIVSSLPQNLLNELKKECGGLQTLLKNNHQIFSVTNGKVKLSAFNKMQEKQTSKRNTRNKGTKFQLKQKPCWFYEFHPDGCPLKNEMCTFRH